MINVNVLSDEGIIVVEPAGPLEQSDFEKLTQEIDTFPGDEHRLVGLVIHTKSFPGWEDFDAFLQHVKFVKEHHKEIQRVAIVTDSRIGAIGPGIATHFVSAHIRHFQYGNIGEAKRWVKEAT